MLRKKQQWIQVMRMYRWKRYYDTYKNYQINIGSRSIFMFWMAIPIRKSVHLLEHQPAHQNQTLREQEVY